MNAAPKYAAHEAAALAIASAADLRPERVTLIGGYSNVLFWLEPYDLVARVSGVSTSVRSDFDWMEREIAVGTFLADNNAASVAPCRILPPGPHLQDGFALTFWQHVDVQPDAPTPYQSGQALVRLHDQLARYSDPLPFLQPLFEGLQMVVRDDYVSALGGDARSLLTDRVRHLEKVLGSRKLDRRPLHGDPHYGNLLSTPDGNLWCDFEDVCAGPVEWDVACLVASSIVLGNGNAAKDALSAYGKALDNQLLDLMIEARTIQAIGWALIGVDNPAEHPRVVKRLQWLAGRSTQD